MVERVFNSFGAEYVHDLSNTGDHDLGTANVPLTDDLTVRPWVSDTGFIIIEMY